MDIEEYKKSMPRCKDCTGFGWGECKTAGENEVACKDFERKKKLTNGDKIRAMTDEELAEMLDIYDVDEICCYCSHRGQTCHNKCYYGIIEWLKQEVKTDDER